MMPPRFALFPALALLPALTASAADAAAAADPSAPPKPYVLFMGADLTVQREKKFYRVEDVVGSELKISINRKEFFVPTRRGQTSLKVDYGLKLTSAAAQLDGWEAGPGYTPANDPRLKFDRESGAAGGAAAVQDLAYGAMISASISSGFATAAAEGPSGSRPGVQEAALRAQANLEEASRQMAVANQSMMQDRYNTGTQANRLALDLNEENYDAMEASFKISSPVELEDPYMVILFRFLEREAKPGQEGMLIHAKSLEPIGTKPKYIRVREGGMPRGFRFVDCQIHIYNRGKEVATNVSPKRVELTRDEAREYFLIEHIGANKDATLPAMPAPGGLSAAARAQLTNAQLSRTTYVKVSPEGVLLAAFADEACNILLDDPSLTAVLGEVFYKPALVKGKPVEGVARVLLSDRSL